MLSKLSEKEMEKIIEYAKKGDKESITIIIENFQGLIVNNYKNRIKDKFNICMDDYTQECNLKIMKCIKEVAVNNYWQLSRLIKISLERKTSDFIKKNENFHNYNMLVEDMTYVYDKNNLSSDHKFDDLIVSDMIVSDSYNNFIKDKLSKEEDNVFSSHISGQCLTKYAEEKGVKVESVKRTLRRAVNKIVNKEQIKEFHCMAMIIFTLLKNIGVTNSV